ncbi:MAG TPA: hypothetical protein DD979_18195 [Gammaproteobacteria bacterium]|nr:hypothetical protein [Gammaproteobacteria bacterium]
MAFPVVPFIAGAALGCIATHLLQTRKAASKPAAAPESAVPAKPSDAQTAVQSDTTTETRRE